MKNKSITYQLFEHLLILLEFEGELFEGFEYAL